MRTQIRSAPPAADDHPAVRTTCGREVYVRRLALGDAERPARRVSLDIRHAPGQEDGTWAALTPAEARQLASALLSEAAAAEQEDGDIPAGRVEVSYAGGEAFEIATRGHVLLTDQAAAIGGSDAAMSPTELFVGALTSCVAFYAGRYLMRHGLSRAGLHVTAEYELAEDRPARVSTVKLTVGVPDGLPPGRQAPLLAVASHCTVHNTLLNAPDVSIELSS